MNILFICFEQFPEGSASSQRILGYTKALIKLKKKTYILAISKQKRSDFCSNISEYEGTIIDNTCIKKGKLDLVSFNKKLKELSTVFSYVHLYGITGSRLIKYIQVIRRITAYNYKIIHEQTEYPFLRREKENILIYKIYMHIYRIYILSHIDYVIVISKQLEKHFRQIYSGKIFIVNMFVDITRFENINKKNPLMFPYIAYVGSMYGDKDGVYNLIKAFGKVSDEFPNYKLVLIGSNSNKKKMKKINEAISRKFFNKIIFTGYLGRDEVPHFLVNSSLLALTRPMNKQAEYGFPTKLGEYLATRKPVLVTNVGDIPFFVKDNYDVFMADANNIDEMANKIKTALSNKNKSVLIGNNGWNTANKYFNNVKETEKLLQFIGQKRK